MYLIHHAEKTKIIMPKSANEDKWKSTGREYGTGVNEQDSASSASFYFYHWRKTCRRTGKASSTLHQYTAVNIPCQYRPFVPQPINLINYSRCASPPADDRCTMNGKHPRIKDKRTKAAHKQKNIASWNPSGDYFLVMVPGHCGDLQNAKIYIGENFWFSTAILPYCHCHTAILP